MIVKDRPFSMDGVDKETIDRINYAMENPTDRSFFIEEFVVDIPEQIKTEPSEAKTASQPTGQQETTEKRKRMDQKLKIDPAIRMISQQKHQKRTMTLLNAPESTESIL